MTLQPYEACYACSGKAQSGTTALQSYILDVFDFSSNMGIYNCRNIAGSNTKSNHSCGKAGDTGIPTGSGGSARPELGDQVVRFLIQYSTELGITEIIYNRVRYSAKYPNGAYYGGSHPHYDHVHWSQTLSKAKSVTRSYIEQIAGSGNGGLLMPKLPLEKGMKSEDVRQLQDLLNRVYGSGISEDADFGPATAGAVAASPMPTYTGDGRDVVKDGEHVNANMWDGLLEDWIDKRVKAVGGGGGGGVSSKDVDNKIKTHANQGTAHDHRHSEGTTGPPK